MAKPWKPGQKAPRVRFFFKFDTCEEIIGKIVQKFSLGQQMYMLAGMCIVSLLIMLRYIWLADFSTTLFATTRIEITIMAVVVGVLVSGFAYYLGMFNSHRATIIISGLHALAEGDIGKKLEIHGKDEFLQVPT